MKKDRSLPEDLNEEYPIDQNPVLEAKAVHYRVREEEIDEVKMDDIRENTEKRKGSLI